MVHEETPILCVNRCGFFGSPANMNMCSKCYKDAVLKQERQAKAAASSIFNGPSLSAVVKIRGRAIVPQPSKPACNTIEGGVNRCTACKKRVGLTAFKCRCGHLFCGSHRYSDKHNCPFDYRTVGREAIAKANPVFKAEKLDKI